MGFFSPKNTPENAVKAQIDAKLAFINDKYTEIGRYVKLRMADKIEEPEVKNLIAQIDATLEELKNLNEQLLTIRGMKLCSGCGHEIPVNMAFCPNCGTKQPEMAQPVYQQPAQGGAVPMGAQPVIQNSQAIIITLFHLLIISHRLILFMAILLSRMFRQPLLSLSLLWHRLLHLSHSLKQHLSLHQCHSLLR